METIKGNCLWIEIVYRIGECESMENPHGSSQITWLERGRHATKISHFWEDF